MAMAVLTQIIEILVGGITKVAEGIGAGLSTLVQQIMVTGSGTTESPYALTTFGIIVVVFAAIGLALGLCRLIVHWVTTLGASRV